MSQGRWARLVCAGGIGLLLVTGAAATSAEPRIVPVDIKPGSCPNPLNVGASGQLSVAILGTPELDPTTIDPATIFLSRDALIWGALSPAMLEADGQSWTEDFVDPITSPVNTLTFSAAGDVTSTLVDCGLGFPDDIPSAATGRICLIERGLILFRDKVQNAANAGAVAAIIYNQADASPGNFRGTLLSPSVIPAVSVSQIGGLVLQGLVGNTAHVIVDSSFGLETFAVPAVTRWSLEDVGAPFEDGACACEALGPDGLMDLTLKLDVPTIVGGLALPAPAFPWVELDSTPVKLLKINGTELDGSPIEGSDCVILKVPRALGRQ